METGVRLRPAVPADAPTLHRWDEEPHVLASDPNDDWQWDIELARSPPWREQLIAELHSAPVGFVEIIDPRQEESHYWGNDVAPDLRALDIWIGEPDARGQGHGETMMRLGISACFENPAVTAIVIDPLASNTRAHAFYQRLGFKPVERRMFGADDTLVHKLTREDWSKLSRSAPQNRTLNQETSRP